MKKSFLHRVFSAFTAFTFVFSAVMPPQMSFAQAVPGSVLNLPLPGAMVATSAGFTPALIKGITPNPLNPLEFNFIVDTGDSGIEGEFLRVEANKLIKYFLASLTVPEDELWVNLSPYEKNRIVPQSFGVTEMGRDLLAQDYMLKQLTASLIYPEDELGKAFWRRIHKKAYEMFGTTDIPMNTFNKVWIVPDRAVVFEHQGSAYVVESHLKVMLEEDYLALRENITNRKFGTDQVGEKQAEAISGVSSEIVREILIPEIEKEVNEGETFANLRQIYHSMILAAWFKKALKESFLGQVYMDQNKVLGVDVKDKDIKQKIYEQYLNAFEKGVYNFIKEDYDPATQEIVPRKYFSGGAMGVKAVNIETVSDFALLTNAQQEAFALNSHLHNVGVALFEAGENVDEGYLDLARDYGLRDNKDRSMIAIDHKEIDPTVISYTLPTENRTKLIVTLGPKSFSDEKIEEFIMEGVDIFRINFSHIKPEEYDFYHDLIERIRAIAAELKRPVAIMQDLRGPKIRVAPLDQPIPVAVGDQVYLYAVGQKPKQPPAGIGIPIDYERIVEETAFEGRILIDDGKIRLQVTSKTFKKTLPSAGASSSFIEAEVVEARKDEIESSKGVNLPDSNISLTSMTPKDYRDLEFGLDADVDIVALSFVRSLDDVQLLRSELKKHNKEDVLVVSKIETPQALIHIDEIIEASDVVMVARGDLAVETSFDDVPFSQRKIVKKARDQATPVIIATQIVSGMEDPKGLEPTRNDPETIVGLVLEQRPDALMLSGETTTGGNPLEAIRFLERTVRRAESIEQPEEEAASIEAPRGAISQFVSRAAVLASKRLIGVQGYVVYSKSGESAREIAALRPQKPIIVITPEPTTIARLMTMRNVYPVLVAAEQLDRAGFVVEANKISKNLFSRQDPNPIEEARSQERPFLLIIRYGTPGLRGGSNVMEVIDLTTDGDESMFARIRTIEKGKTEIIDITNNDITIRISDPDKRPQKPFVLSHKDGFTEVSTRGEADPKKIRDRNRKRHLFPNDEKPVFFIQQIVPGRAFTIGNLDAQFIQIEDRFDDAILGSVTQLYEMALIELTEVQIKMTETADDDSRILKSYEEYLQDIIQFIDQWKPILESRELTIEEVARMANEIEGFLGKFFTVKEFGFSKTSEIRPSLEAILNEEVKFLPKGAARDKSGFPDDRAMIAIAHDAFKKIFKETNSRFPSMPKDVVRDFVLGIIDAEEAVHRITSRNPEAAQALVKSRLEQINNIKAVHLERLDQKYQTLVDKRFMQIFGIDDAMMTDHIKAARDSVWNNEHYRQALFLRASRKNSELRQKEHDKAMTGTGMFTLSLTARMILEQSGLRQQWLDISQMTIKFRINGHLDDEVKAQHLMNGLINRFIQKEPSGSIKDQLAVVLNEALPAVLETSSDIDDFRNKIHWLEAVLNQKEEDWLKNDWRAQLKSGIDDHVDYAILAELEKIKKILHRQLAQEEQMQDLHDAEGGFAQIYLNVLSGLAKAIEETEDEVLDIIFEGNKTNYAYLDKTLIPRFEALLLGAKRRGSFDGRDENKLDKNTLKQLEGVIDSTIAQELYEKLERLLDVIRTELPVSLEPQADLAMTTDLVTLDNKEKTRVSRTVLDQTVAALRMIETEVGAPGLGFLYNKARDPLLTGRSLYGHDLMLKIGLVDPEGNIADHNIGVIIRMAIQWLEAPEVVDPPLVADRAMVSKGVEELLRREGDTEALQKLYKAIGRLDGKDGIERITALESLRDTIESLRERYKTDFALTDNVVHLQGEVPDGADVAMAVQKVRDQLRSGVSAREVIRDNNLIWLSAGDTARAILHTVGDKNIINKSADRIGMEKALALAGNGARFYADEAQRFVFVVQSDANAQSVQTDLRAGTKAEAVIEKYPLDWLIGDERQRAINKVSDIGGVILNPDGEVIDRDMALELARERSVRFYTNVFETFVFIEAAEAGKYKIQEELRMGRDPYDVIEENDMLRLMRFNLEIYLDSVFKNRHGMIILQGGEEIDIEEAFDLSEDLKNAFYIDPTQELILIVTDEAMIGSRIKNALRKHVDTATQHLIRVDPDVIADQIRVPVDEVRWHLEQAGAIYMPIARGRGEYHMSPSQVESIEDEAMVTKAEIDNLLNGLNSESPLVRIGAAQDLLKLLNSNQIEDFMLIEEIAKSLEAAKRDEPEENEGVVKALEEALDQFRLKSLKMLAEEAQRGEHQIIDSLRKEEAERNFDTAMIVHGDIDDPDVVRQLADAQILQDQPAKNLAAIHRARVRIKEAYDARNITDPSLSDLIAVHSIANDSTHPQELRQEASEFILETYKLKDDIISVRDVMAASFLASDENIEDDNEYKKGAQRFVAMLIENRFPFSNLMHLLAAVALVKMKHPHHKDEAAYYVSFVYNRVQKDPKQATVAALIASSFAAISKDFDVAAVIRKDLDPTIYALEVSDAAMTTSAQKVKSDIKEGKRPAKVLIDNELELVLGDSQALEAFIAKILSRKDGVVIDKSANELDYGTALNLINNGATVFTDEHQTFAYIARDVAMVATIEESVDFLTQEELYAFVYNNFYSLPEPHLRYKDQGDPDVVSARRLVIAENKDQLIVSVESDGISKRADHPSTKPIIIMEISEDSIELLLDFERKLNDLGYPVARLEPLTVGKIHRKILEMVNRDAALVGEKAAIHNLHQHIETLKDLKFLRLLKSLAEKPKDAALDTEIFDVIREYWTEIRDAIRHVDLFMINAIPTNHQLHQALVNLLHLSGKTQEVITERISVLEAGDAAMAGKIIKGADRIGQYSFEDDDLVRVVYQPKAGLTKAVAASSATRVMGAVLATGPQEVVGNYRKRLSNQTKKFVIVAEDGEVWHFSMGQEAEMFDDMVIKVEILRKASKDAESQIDSAMVSEVVQEALKTIKEEAHKAIAKLDKIKDTTYSERRRSLDNLRYYLNDIRKQAEAWMRLIEENDGVLTINESHQVVLQANRLLSSGWQERPVIIDILGVTWEFEQIMENFQLFLSSRPHLLERKDFAVVKIDDTLSVEVYDLRKIVAGKRKFRILFTPKDQKGENWRSRFGRLVYTPYDYDPFELANYIAVQVRLNRDRYRGMNGEKRLYEIIDPLERADDAMVTGELKEKVDELIDLTMSLEADPRRILVWLDYYLLDEQRRFNAQREIISYFGDNTKSDRVADALLEVYLRIVEKSKGQDDSTRESVVRKWVDRVNQYVRDQIFPDGAMAAEEGAKADATDAAMVAKEYVQRIVDIEKQINDHNGDQEKVMNALRDFIDNLMGPQIMDVRKGLLTDHSLWRMFQDSFVRQQAIKVIRFMELRTDPLNIVAFVTVLGRFVNEDNKVRAFMESIVMGTDTDIGTLNEVALNKIREALYDSKEFDQLPSLEDDLRLLGLDQAQLPQDSEDTAMVAKIISQMDDPYLLEALRILANADIRDFEARIIPGIGSADDASRDLESEIVGIFAKEFEFIQQEKDTLSPQVSLDRYSGILIKIAILLQAEKEKYLRLIEERLRYVSKYARSTVQVNDSDDIEVLRPKLRNESGIHFNSRDIDTFLERLREHSIDNIEQLQVLTLLDIYLLTRGTKIGREKLRYLHNFLKRQGIELPLLRPINPEDLLVALEYLRVQEREFSFIDLGYNSYILFIVKKLEKRGIKTFGDFLSTEPKNLLAIEGVTEKSINEIKKLMFKNASPEFRTQYASFFQGVESLITATEASEDPAMMGRIDKRILKALDEQIDNDTLQTFFEEFFETVLSLKYKVESGLYEGAEDDYRRALDAFEEHVKDVEAKINMKLKVDLNAGTITIDETDGAMMGEEERVQGPGSRVKETDAAMATTFEESTFSPFYYVASKENDRMLLIYFMFWKQSISQEFTEFTIDGILNEKVISQNQTFNSVYNSLDRLESIGLVERLKTRLKTFRLPGWLVDAIHQEPEKVRELADKHLKDVERKVAVLDQRSSADFFKAAVESEISVIVDPAMVGEGIRLLLRALPIWGAITGVPAVMSAQNFDSIAPVVAEALVTDTVDFNVDSLTFSDLLRLYEEKREQGIDLYMQAYMLDKIVYEGKLIEIKTRTDEIGLWYSFVIEDLQKGIYAHKNQLVGEGDVLSDYEVIRVYYVKPEPSIFDAAHDKAPGGIDLNPALLDLQIKRDVNGVPLPVNLQPIDQMKIEGFLPVIINITPINMNLPMFLGLVPKDGETEFGYKPDMKARTIEQLSYVVR